MKPNENTYPLAESGELYKRIIEIIKPLLSGIFVFGKRIYFNNCTMDVVKIGVKQDNASFLLKDYINETRLFLGVEVNSAFGYDNKQTSVRWFTFHEQDRRQVFHDTPEQAMNDPNAWIPPEYDWSYNSTEGNPGYMDWDWWKSSVSEIKAAFKKEGLSLKHWNASPSRFVNVMPYCKNTVICLNEKTEQHLGFLQIQRDCCVVMQIPFVYADETPCFFATINDALSFPQDTFDEFGMDIANWKALLKWKHILAAD